MKALVIATQRVEREAEHTDPKLKCLLPLLDRPLVQRIVEHLADRGVTEFHFLVRHGAGELERLLGDGTRWGVRIEFHLTSEASKPYQLLGTPVFSPDDGPVLLVHADRLPMVDVAHWCPADTQVGPSLFCWTPPAADGRLSDDRWSGWGWIPGRALVTLPHTATARTVERWLFYQARHFGDLVAVDRPYSAECPAELLRSNIDALAAAPAALPITGREQAGRVWVGNHAQVHASASVIGRTYIGEDCRIGPGVHLGPNAVIGRGCIVDRDTAVSNAVVLSDSFVGQGLDVCDAIIDRNTLINVRLETQVVGLDDIIIGSTVPNLRQTFVDAGSRLLASLALVVASPILGITVLGRLAWSRRPHHVHVVTRGPAAGNVVGRWQKIRFPTFGPLPELEAIDSTVPTPGLRDLFCRVLPGLVAVARGDLNWVGLDARTEPQLRRMSPAWRQLYMRVPPGLFTRAQVRGQVSTSDELHAAEVFYAATQSIPGDLAIVGKYFLKIVQPLTHRVSRLGVRRDDQGLKTERTRE